MNSNKKDTLKNISPDDKSLLEVLNTSYLSIDDVKWLKSKRWFKRFLKVYSKELQKRFNNTNNNVNNNVSNSSNKELLDYTRSLDVEEEVIEILDFTRTIDVTNVNDIVKANEKAKKKVKIEKAFYGAFITLCIFILMILIVVIINWILENKKTDNIIDDIYEVAEIEEITTTEKKDKNIEQEVITTTIEDSLYTKYNNMNMIKVNFDNLLKINNDTKGWIMVPGTNVNYPFVQSNDNLYYLKHSYDKSSNKKGWVFLDYRNNMDNLSKNTIIYAHGLVNNQMFGSLRKILKSSWYNNKNNHIIKLSTPTSNQLWQVFSTYTIEPEDYYITTSFSSDEEFQEFINIIKSRSVYDYGTKINTNDNILTLSSCYSDTKRMVLHAKLIKSD